MQVICHTRPKPFNPLLGWIYFREHRSILPFFIICHHSYGKRRWHPPSWKTRTYHKISNTRCTKSPNLNVSCLILQFSLCNLLKPGVKVKNEDVVGAALIGDAPTTSKWSTIPLPTKVHLTSEVWWYLSSTVNALVDDLAPQGARGSEAMLWT